MSDGPVKITVSASVSPEMVCALAALDPLRRLLREAKALKAQLDWERSG